MSGKYRDVFSEQADLGFGSELKKKEEKRTMKKLAMIGLGSLGMTTEAD